jgi:hypothetical protein
MKKTNSTLLKFLQILKPFTLKVFGGGVIFVLGAGLVLALPGLGAFKNNWKNRDILSIEALNSLAGEIERLRDETDALTVKIPRLITKTGLETVVSNLVTTAELETATSILAKASDEKEVANRVLSLESEAEKLNTSIGIKNKKIVFMVTKNSDEKISPYRAVHWDKAYINEGGAYDFKKGTFVAPESGTYYFQANLVTKIEEPYDGRGRNYTFHVNG